MPAHDRKARRSRKEIYDKLPHEEEIIDLPEPDRFDANGQPLVRVGKVLLRTEVRSVPAKHWCVTIIPFNIRQLIPNPEHANL